MNTHTIVQISDIPSFESTTATSADDGGRVGGGESEVLWSGGSVNLTRNGNPK